MKNELLNFLQIVLGNSKKVSENEYLFYCKHCNHRKPKLAINIDTKKGHCWIGCEKSHGSIQKILKNANVSDENIKKYFEITKQTISLENFDKKLKDKCNIKVNDLYLPNEFKSLIKKDSSIEYKNALSYLKKRKVNIYDIIKYNIGYCDAGKYKQRIIIPSYDKENKINYFIARSYYDNNLKYLNPKAEKNIVFNENQISWKFPVTICEGVFDAIIGIKRNAIPILGKTLPKKLLEKIILEKPPRVNIALDKDAFYSAIKIVENILSTGISTYFIELTDKDPADIGFDNMTKLIDNAKEMTFKDLIMYKL